MRYVIWTAISHGHIEYQITLGSQGCIINSGNSFMMELIGIVNIWNRVLNRGK